MSRFHPWRCLGTLGLPLASAYCGGHTNAGSPAPEGGTSEAATGSSGSPHNGDAASGSSADASGSDVVSADATAATADASPPMPDAAVATAPEAGSAPGAYVMVSGSTMDGTYLLLSSSSCAGTFNFTFMGASNMGIVTVNVLGISNPQVGATYMTPKVTVDLQLGSVDDGTYPQAGHGTCSATDTNAGWPTMGTVPFSCTGLVGSSSGKVFSIAGEIVC